MILKGIPFTELEVVQTPLHCMEVSVPLEQENVDWVEFMNFSEDIIREVG